MKKYAVLVLLSMTLLLCGCYDGNEPNDIAYITAMGFDKAENDNYNITIQFAKPTQISGGTSEQGGKGGSEILENIMVEAPTIYAAINISNHIVSKKFSLAHTKLFVFSEELAREGLKDFTQTMARSEEVRPNVYMAVSQTSANEYLKSNAPVIEVNPAKYYQLVFEENEYNAVPLSALESFYFYQTSPEKDNVLPIAGVFKSEKEIKGESSGGSQGSSGGSSGSEGGSSGGSGGGSEGGSGGGSGGSSGGSSEGGGSSSSKEDQNALQKNAPVNEEGFEYKLKNYLAGEVAIEEENKSEVIGSAVFHNDYMVGTLRSIETELFNILNGDYRSNYTTFHGESENSTPVTVKIEQNQDPKVKVELDESHAKVKFDVKLEADFRSLPSEYLVEQDIKNFEEKTGKDIENAMLKFLNKTTKEFQSDILGIGGIVKRKFLTYPEFEAYNWPEKYKDTEFEVHVKFKVRQTGLTVRTEAK
jgi:spore germination protein KC